MFGDIENKTARVLVHLCRPYPSCEPSPGSAYPLLRPTREGAAHLESDRKSTLTISLRKHRDAILPRIRGAKPAYVGQGAPASGAKCPRRSGNCPEWRGEPAGFPQKFVR